MARVSCPGPGRSDECADFLCRRNGCFGRPPEPRREPRDILPGVEDIAAAVLGIATGK